MKRNGDGMSNLEAEFLQYWRMIVPSRPQPEREYQFLEGRRFRFDFCFVPQRVAVELEGAVFQQGRHTRGKGYESDCEKYNLAVLNGYKVLRFTRGMLQRDPHGCISQVLGAIEANTLTLNRGGKHGRV